MIIVKNATRQMPAEKWIDQVIGLTDERGNPFQIVRLTSLRPCVTYSKTAGFEDAIISTRAGKPHISYRSEGSAQWMRTIMGTFQAIVPITDHNLKVLAGSFYDKLWEINDAQIKTLVKRMADAIEAKMSPELKEFNKKRREELHRKQFDNPGVSTPSSVLEADLDRQDKAADAREMELVARESDLRKREMALQAREASISRLVGEGPFESPITRESLDLMLFAELRTMARTVYKLKPKMTATKGDIIDMILARIAEDGGVESPDAVGLPAGDAELVGAEPERIS